MTESRKKVKGKYFQMTWEGKYGVKVAERDPATDTVISASCQFCERFDRENESADRKRKRASNVKYFKAPWSSDNIERHMTMQHLKKYEEYKAAEGNENFFVTTYEPLVVSNDGVNMLVNKCIVDKIIGDLLLDTELTMNT